MQSQTRGVENGAVPASQSWREQISGQQKKSTAKGIGGCLGEADAVPCMTKAEPKF